MLGIARAGLDHHETAMDSGKKYHACKIPVKRGRESAVIYKELGD